MEEKDFHAFFLFYLARVYRIKHRNIYKRCRPMLGRFKRTLVSSWFQLGSALLLSMVDRSKRYQSSSNITERNISRDKIKKENT